jgi:hypothetical protein
MGFLGESGEINHFAVVTIFQRFFPLCIQYRSIIRPEYIYFVYHNYAIMDLIRILQTFFAQVNQPTKRLSSEEIYENRALENYFYSAMKFTCWFEEGGDMSLFPLALFDDHRAPVRGFIVSASVGVKSP